MTSIESFVFVSLGVERVLRSGEAKPHFLFSPLADGFLSDEKDGPKEEWYLLYIGKFTRWFSFILKVTFQLVTHGLLQVLTISFD